MNRDSSFINGNQKQQKNKFLFLINNYTSLIQEWRYFSEPQDLSKTGSVP